MMAYAYALEHHLYEGDTQPWTVRFIDRRTREPMDLSGMDVVLYMIRIPDQALVIDGEDCTHNDDGGEVTYDWTEDDVDTPGEYRVQWKFTLPSGKTQRYPLARRGVARVVIERAYGEDD